MSGDPSPTLLRKLIIGRAGTRAVEELAGGTLAQLGTLVQTDTEAQLRQAHDVLNGFFPDRLDGAQAERARRWLRTPERFEPMAFALVRQAPATPVVHFGNLDGAYLGVERADTGVRVAVRTANGRGREIFAAPA